jgi:hypothetical protein
LGLRMRGRLTGPILAGFDAPLLWAQTPKFFR